MSRWRTLDFFLLLHEHARANLPPGKLAQSRHALDSGPLRACRFTNLQMNGLLRNNAATHHDGASLRLDLGNHRGVTTQWKISLRLKHL